MTWSAARIAGLFAAATALPAAAQSPAQTIAAVQTRSTGTPESSVTAGTRYRASGLHRLVWGNNYRRLWTAPVTLPVLDLAGYAGGLRPTGRGGGRQTMSLHLEAADGRKFSFRSVERDAIRILPPDLQTSVIGRIWQDEVSAFLPAGSLIVPPLARAVGVLAVEPRLLVMPDDPALGEIPGAIRRYGGDAGTVAHRSLRWRQRGAHDRRPGAAGAAEPNRAD